MRVEIEAERLLFEFDTLTRWKNKAASWFTNTRLRPHQYISVDTAGRICPTGNEYMRADREGTFPIRVYRIA